jgi:preprotein translocase subunit SecA
MQNNQLRRQAYKGLSDHTKVSINLKKLKTVLLGSAEVSKNQATNQNKNQNQNQQVNVNQQKSYAQSLKLDKKQVSVEKNGHDTSELLFPEFRKEITHIKKDLSLDEKNQTVLLPNPVHGISAISQDANNKMKELGITDICVTNLPILDQGRFYLKPVYLKNYIVKDKQLNKKWDGYLVYGKKSQLGNVASEHQYQFCKVHLNSDDPENIKGEYFQLCYDKGVDQRKKITDSDEIFAPIYSQLHEIKNGQYLQFNDIDPLSDQDNQPIFSEQEWQNFIAKKTDQLKQVDIDKFNRLIEKDQSSIALTSDQKNKISQSLKANIPLHVIFQVYGAKGVIRLADWYSSNQQRLTSELKESLTNQNKLSEALETWNVFEVELGQLMQHPERIKLLSVMDQSHWVTSIKQVNRFAESIQSISNNLKDYHQPGLTFSQQNSWDMCEDESSSNPFDYTSLVEMLDAIDVNSRSLVLYRLLEVLKRVDNPQEVINQFILGGNVKSSQNLPSVFSEYGLYQAIATEGISHLEEVDSEDPQNFRLLNHDFQSQKNGLSHLRGGEQEINHINEFTLSTQMIVSYNNLPDQHFIKKYESNICKLIPLAFILNITEQKELEMTHYDLVCELEHDALIKNIVEKFYGYIECLLRNKYSEPAALTSPAKILTKYARVLTTAKRQLGPDFKVFWSHMAKHLPLTIEEQNQDLNPELDTSLDQIDAILKDDSLSTQVQALAPCFQEWQPEDFTNANMALLANYTFHKKITASKKTDFIKLLDQSKGKELSSELIGRFQLEQLEDLGDPHYLTKKLRISLKNNSELGSYFPELNLQADERQTAQNECKKEFDNDFNVPEVAKGIIKSFQSHYQACLNNWYADDENALGTLKDAQLQMFFDVIKLKNNTLVKTFASGVSEQLDAILREMTQSLNQSVEISLKQLKSKLSEKCPDIGASFDTFTENCKNKYYVDVNDLQGGDGNHSEKLKRANETAPQLIKSFQKNLKPLSDVIDYQVFFNHLKDLKDEDQLAVGEQFLTWYAGQKDQIYVLSSEIVKNYFTCSPDQRKQFEQCDWSDLDAASFQFQACQQGLTIDQINVIKMFPKDKQEAWINYFHHNGENIKTYLAGLPGDKKDQKAYLDPTFFGHFGEFLLGQDANNEQLESIKSALMAAYHQGGIDQLSEVDIASLTQNIKSAFGQANFIQQICELVRRHSLRRPSFAAWANMPKGLISNNDDKKVEYWLYQHDIQAKNRPTSICQANRLSQQLMQVNNQGEWFAHTFGEKLENQLVYFDKMGDRKLEEIYQKNTASLRYCKTHQLNEHLHLLKQAINGDVSHSDNKLALAYLRELFYRSSGKFPNQTQIMSVWLSLTDQKVGLNINTGEGKSITSALIAAMRWVQGYQASVVTSDSVLAARDLASVQPFFEMLGIDSGLIDGDSQSDTCFKDIVYSTPSDLELYFGQAVQKDIVYSTPSDLELYFGQAVQKDIVYSTPSDLELYFGQAVQNGWQLKTGKRALILDEADYHLIDSQFDYNLVKGGGNQQSPNKAIYRSVAKFVDGQAVKTDNMTTQEVSTLFQKFISHLQHDSQVQSRLKLCFGEPIQWDDQYTQTTCENWLKSAIQAWQVKQSNRDGDKTHYVIGEVNKFGRLYKVCTLYDAQNRKDPDAQYNDGVQAFLHTFEDLVGKGDFWVEDEPQLQVTSNFNRLAKRYTADQHIITGITGTLGSQQELKYLQQKYGFELYKVPTHKKNQRIEKQKFYYENQKEQVENIKELISKNKNRPILIFAQNTDQDAERLLLSLKDKVGSRELINVCQMGQDEEKKELEKTFSNQVIIANDKWGRGTDLKLGDTAKQKGLLVIHTCPLHDRSFGQRSGRTARHGEKGEVIEVYAQQEGTIKTTRNTKNKQVIDKKIAYDQKSNTKETLLTILEQAIDNAPEKEKQILVQETRKLINNLDFATGKDFQNCLNHIQSRGDRDKLRKFLELTFSINLSELDEKHDNLQALDLAQSSRVKKPREVKVQWLPANNQSKLSRNKKTYKTSQQQLHKNDSSLTSVHNQAPSNKKNSKNFINQHAQSPVGLIIGAIIGAIAGGLLGYFVVAPFLLSLAAGITLPAIITTGVIVTSATIVVGLIVGIAGGFVGKLIDSGRNSSMQDNIRTTATNEAMQNTVNSKSLQTSSRFTPQLNNGYVEQLKNRDQNEEIMPALSH